MLRALPLQTVGDIARAGLELHVYCPSCYSTRRLGGVERWADRCFATACFRCSGTRYTGAPCKAIGMPVIRPAQLLPVGGPMTLAFLWCNSCPWEIASRPEARLFFPTFGGARCPARWTGRLQGGHGLARSHDAQSLRPPIRGSARNTTRTAALFSACIARARSRPSQPEQSITGGFAERAASSKK